MLYSHRKKKVQEHRLEIVQVLPCCRSLRSLTEKKLSKEEIRADLKRKMEEEGNCSRHQHVPVPAYCQQGAVVIPVSCKQRKQDSRGSVGLNQQHIWEVSLRQAQGPLSLPLVDLHRLLSQRSQEVGLVHFQGADIQHRQVSLQLLQQGAAASIP